MNASILSIDLTPRQQWQREQALELDRLLIANGYDPAKVKFAAPPVCHAAWTAKDWFVFITNRQPQK